MHSSDARREALDQAVTLARHGEIAPTDIILTAKDFQTFLEGGHEKTVAAPEPKLRTFRVESDGRNPIHQLVFEIKPGRFAAARSRRDAETKSGFRSSAGLGGFRLFDIETGEQLTLA
jgi:hypothetical protein